MANQKQSISVEDYINTIEEKRKNRYIDLDDYQAEIQTMLDSGLSAHKIYGWFKENKLPMTYARVIAFVRGADQNNAKQNRPAGRRSTTYRKPDNRSQKATENKDKPNKVLPSLHDDID